MITYSYNQASDVVECDVEELLEIAKNMHLGHAIYAYNSDDENYCTVIMGQRDKYCLVFESPTNNYAKFVDKAELSKFINVWINFGR